MISLQTLKDRAAKQRSDGELVVDRFFARRVSIYLTWLLAHSPLSANQVTLVSLLVMLAGMVCVAMPAAYAPVVGVALLLLGYVLDCCDGEIARYRGQQSLRGVYLDTLGHAITIPAIFIAAGVGQMLRHGTIESLALGAVAAIAATSPAKAALTALKSAKGVSPRNSEDDSAHVAPPGRLKSLYLRTLGRLAIFPNSMFVLCIAILADLILVGRRGALYYATVFYAALLLAEQAAAAASWSREDRLAQEVHK